MATCCILDISFLAVGAHYSYDSEQLSLVNTDSEELSLSIFPECYSTTIVATLVYMSMHAPKILQLWHTAGSDFIKTNHQFHIKPLRKLHNIFIKIGTLCNVLSLIQYYICI